MKCCRYPLYFIFFTGMVCQFPESSVLVWLLWFCCVTEYIDVSWVARFVTNSQPNSKWWNSCTCRFGNDNAVIAHRRSQFAEAISEQFSSFSKIIIVYVLRFRKMVIISSFLSCEGIRNAQMILNLLVQLFLFLKLYGYQ